MNTIFFDRDRYLRWIGGLALEALPQDPNLYQLTVCEDEIQTKALAWVLGALERRPLRQELGATQLIERICVACRAIAAGELRHLGSEIVKQHFFYHDGIVAQFNGVGLGDMFVPFVLRRDVDETTRILRTCLFEFVSHIAAGLADLGILGADPQMPPGRVVIINGFHRTGSTKVFVAAKAILDVLGIGATTFGMELSDVDRLLERVDLGAFAGQWVIVKCHLWMPRKKRENVVVFFTRRHLADVVASEYRLRLARLRKDEPVPANIGGMHARMHQFIYDYVQPQYDLTVIEYDDYFGRDEKLIGFLAEQMGLLLSQAQLKAASDIIAVDRAKEIADSLQTGVDRETFLRPHHISDTMGRPRAGLKDLPQPIIDELKHFGNWPEDAEENPST